MINYFIDNIESSLLISIVVYLCIILIGSYVSYYLIHNDDNEIHFNKLNKNSTFIDIFYFNICTLSSVGYGDIYPISQKAKCINIIQQFIILVLLLDGTLGLKKFLNLFK